MGVHGLWELLAPVGRRVSVETLAGKKLAIDASIWMIQFMKAMRDEKGEMVRNAHILGFFRRICKLLYLRTKPVFVFDGGTPALKRRTVIARRRQRENAQAKIRKTAEKLLLNHVKAMRLKELAADLENQRQKNDIKGKKAIREESNMEQKTDRGNGEVAKNYSQEELDEMLAASLAAEENEGFTTEASTSGAGILGDKVYRDEGGDEGEGEGEGEGGDEDEDEDEEMILPEMHGKVDPAVLAALPPSMQLDLLVQMRERLMAENRQKYQKVKKAPTRFSELQIQAYLKTVAFRREIDGVQKSAIGRGIGGVQTSRIASEANREFIFSTSFTGDKETLTAVGQERNNGEHNQNPSINSFNSVVNEVRSTTRSVATKGLNEDETGKGLHHDVNTYLDERGRLRVSRVRALGIRMTRDLQRNLDLMKEIEQEKADANQKKHSETTATKTLEDVLCNTSDRIEHQEVGELNNDGTNDEDTKTEDPAVEFGTTLEISFEDTGDDEYGNDDDDLFATLVAGDPVVDFSIDNSASLKQSLHSNSDCEWEEGVIEDKSNVVSNHNKAYNKQSLLEGGMSDEVEIEWDEGSQCIQVDSSFRPHERPKIVTKGALVEEAEFQEAIRRSLQDMIDQRPMNKPHEGLETGRAEKIVSGDNNRMSVHKPEVQSPAMDPLQQRARSCSTNIVETEEAAFAPCMEFSPAKSHLIQNHFDQETVESLAGETSDILLEEKYLCRTKEQMIDVCSIGGNGHVTNKPVDTRSGELAHNGSSAVSSSFTDSFPDRLPDHDLGDAQHGGFHEEIDAHSCKTAKSTTISANDFITDADCTKDLSLEKGQPIRNHAFMDVDEEHEVNEDYLEEEMLFLDKEREELGSEQRKLERNAESVSSEMFAECQELLQMFGLPYIIAPMEAEAQCANMEFLNLVDGVVTDDSDAFLFGARSVYKNIFDDRKYVETYFMKDIENELGLNREKIISMALLLGSDYTEGVSGIGIVNAIEVVNAFPEQNGLHEFREWIESPDPTILGSIDVLPGGKSKRKGSKSSETITSSSSSKVDEISCDQNDNNKMKQIFMDKHRNVSKNWHIPSSFPSDAVIQAYTSPQVDKSTEPFSWGKPDLFLLRKLCWEKFGWGSSKADDLLLPVLKEYNKHETQLRLEAFYTFNERFAKIRSKRIKKAVKGITGNKSSELLDEGMPQQSGIGKKRKVKPSEEEAKKSRVSLKGPECAGTSNQISTTEEPKVEQSKRGWRKEKSSELSNLKQSASRDPNLSTRKELHKRGRQKEQGRGKQTRRGRKKQNDSETSHDDADNGSYSEREGELQFDNSEESCHVRRSARFHKAVNYTLSDEFDYCEKIELDGGTTKVSYMEEAIGGKETDVNEVEDLGIGGESFVDETAPVNTTGAKGTSQDDDCFRNGQVNEYLQLGGGFCLDEEDGNTEFDGHAPSPTRETTSEKSDVLTSFDHVEEGKPESGMLNLNPTRAQNERGIDASDTQSMNNDDSRVSNTVLLNSLDDTENEPENYSVRSLRAMPNLRRKKRRT